MAATNPQLQAAIAGFAAQAGVSPDQVAQLRAAIAAAPDLARSLASQVANGHLAGFALEPPVYSPSLVGTYDAKSHVVTLPATVFQPAGQVPSQELTASLRLQEMSIRFSQASAVDSNSITHAVTPVMVANLQAAINSSPVLAGQIGKLVTTVDPTDPGHRLLENFSPLVDTVAGGTYSGSRKAMSLPLNDLSAATPGSYGATDMVFVLGHEVQHGFNHADAVAAVRLFASRASQIARSNTPAHDYTQTISQAISAGRNDEASAQLAGWNALLSRERTTNPAAGLREMLNLGNNRILDFVALDAQGNLMPRPGLAFDQDHMLPQTPVNISAEAGYYFDKFPVGTPGKARQDTVGLGYRGDSDYPNVYGASLVSTVINIERHFAHKVDGKPAEIHIDMAAVRLSEPLLEHNGIDIRIDPGVNQPYYDSGQSPPALHHFDNTVDRSKPGTFHNYLQNVTPRQEALEQGGGPDEPGHPDHALLEQIRAGVRRIDEGVGKPYDAMSERISRCLLAACKDGRDMYPDAPGIRPGANALRRVDHVVMGETGNVFAVEGRLDDPAHRRAFVAIERAIGTPVEQSDAKLEAANRAIADSRSQVQQVVAQAMDPHGRGHPAMIR